ncbi:MAG TPA: cell envelope integrity protein TolA [Candidatus Binatia bacterium]|nr:cell envelope integrity protein TolA [Candidatus Binatia bacterium]
MTPRKPVGGRERQEDNSLSRMVVISAVLHLIVITAVVITATRNWPGRTPQVAYTVALVDPAALGTNLPGGGDKPAPPRAQPAPAVKEPPAAKNEAPKAVPPPQLKEVKEPPAAKKEGLKPPPVKEQEAVKLPDKEKPAEKPPPKPEAEKKAEEKKPEAKKPEAKPQPAAAKPEEKKPQPAKVETPPSAEERDKQIASAIEKIKGKIQSKEKDSAANPPGGFSSPVNGSGPTTLGGAAGQGGGGVVRGLEFIMYTEQVKRRVKESWIVTEKKPGLTATVRFGVQPDGEVFAIELVKRSGDRAFDESVVRAVSKANPLPPPPQTYQQEFATQKVEVTFGGEERTN